MGSLSNHSDQELLIRLRKGDVPAFDELYFRYVKKLMAFALTFFPNKELAKDAVQDIFTRIWINRAELDSSKSFKTYLFQAVKFYMYNYARDKRGACTLEEVPEHAILNESMVESDMDFRDLQSITNSCIEKLPKVQQEVYKLNKLEGFSATEIAIQMNLSQRTIEHHIYLASKTIKKEMQTRISYRISLAIALTHLSSIL
ncbi:RNA polymerase sigma-70 factor [Algoriphagus aestuariicola]|uniref:RNA polymerase sigma-70 factor n=1 Tax=Algoriphagus aestuariicola TaxID=1852016 RepID=A0ABS3BLC3_9BACT|nr:RNA polymerase sigma-70 factor [Algoriphagus aestuariicola]